VYGLERVVPLPSPESGGWPGRLASRLAGLAELRPSEDVSRLAGEVHALGFARYSDGALRDALADVQGDPLPWVFGIVDEAVSRRLGAWRLFDEDHAHPLQDIARSIVETGAYRSDPAYQSGTSYIDSPAFGRIIQDAVDEAGLGDLDGEIVRGMVYVAERGRGDYGTNIHLPARFYQALATRDTDDALRMRATDEQLKAGELLYYGRVVEMEAGEGKTIAAAFPAVLHTTEGRRVHIVTANDYLALRDAEWLAPVYESLGLTVRAVLATMEDAERRDAYRADVVYATVRELGFDFLRDNMRFSAAESVQGGLDVAIVDEADQALVDESQTPLIISGGDTPATRSVHRANKVVVDMAVAQREVVESVEADLREPGHEPKYAKSLLVRLALADPRSETLASHLEGDGRLRARVRSAALMAASSKNASESPTLEGLYYHVDLEHGLVTLTDLGHEFVEGRLGPVFDTSELESEISGVQSDHDTELEERRASIEGLVRRLSRRQGQMNQVHQALTAHLLLRRDDDYVVTEDTVVLVDGPTGRARPDSRYQHGLQSAIEAKEGVRVREDTAVLGQISIQGFMRQYESLAGMTGTARNAQDELRREYGLSVAAVPPTRPSRRVDRPAKVYHTRRDKLHYLADQVGHWNRIGRPVLIGTVTVEQSEEVSVLLTQCGIDHRVLNAVRNAEEAEIVRSAGRFGAVTVATNMAGRGTDILLDRELDSAIAARCAEIVSEALEDGASEARVDCETLKDANTLEAALAETDGLQLSRDDMAVVVSHDLDPFNPIQSASMAFGCGLHVIGTELNDSGRVDAQLRGRAGRQGSSGSSGFVLSLEDRFLAVAGIGELPKADADLDAAGGHFFEGAATTRVLASAMSWVERDTEAGRTIMSDYQRVLEEQTLAYYEARRDILADDRFHIACIALAQEAAARMVERHFPTASPGSYADRFNELADEASLDYGLDCSPMWELGVEALSEEIADAVANRIAGVRDALGGPVFDAIEKVTFVQTADEAWQAHLGLLDGMMAAMVLSPWGHRTAVSDFSARCREAYAGFREGIVDDFVPRLLDAVRGGGDEADPPVENSVLSELQAILG
jgi:preprotein translocase subunit SecA